MKSTMLSSALLVVFLLLALTGVQVQGKAVVRGAHKLKGLKHYAMHARQLKEDKNKEQDEVLAAEDTPEPTDPPKDDKDDEGTEDVLGAEDTPEPTDPPKDKEDEETPEPTDPPKDKEDEPEETPEPTDPPKDKDDEPEETPEPTEPPKDKDEDTDEPEPEEGTLEPTEEGDKTEAPDVVEGIIEDIVETNVTDPEEVPDSEVANVTVVLPGEVFSVPLEPFSLTVEGDIEEEDMDMETYLAEYMGQSMDNLVEVSLYSWTDADLEEEEVVEAETTDQDQDSNSTRKLRSYNTVQHRVLAVQTTFYYEGNATFEGPPSRDAEEVDAALTQALTDTEALQTHLEKAAPGSNATITEVVVDADATATDPPTDSSANGAQSDETDDSGGLNTTGLVIVIVAACIGGIALLIILLVGMNGTGGPATGGMKGAGLPEQPLQ